MILGPIAVKLVQALHFLHEEMRVIHLDVKPENILCSLAGDVKISDFGASRQLKQNSGGRLQVQGTLYYMSPERIDGREHFFDSDCWSLGVTLLEAAIGHYPFAVSDAEKKELIFWDLRHRIVAHPWQVVLTEEFGLSAKFVSFIDACLQLDRRMRASAEQLIGHAFYQEYSHCGINLLR